MCSSVHGTQLENNLVRKVQVVHYTLHTLRFGYSTFRMEPSGTALCLAQKLELNDYHIDPDIFQYHCMDSCNNCTHLDNKPSCKHPRTSQS